MALSLSNLKPSRGSRSNSKRVGRGNASGKGTTAGRGTKGQKARTGGRGRNKIRGMRRLVLATPKLRGFSRQGTETVAVNLRDIQNAFREGAVINPRNLRTKGLIASSDRTVKILGTGVLKKAVRVEGCLVSVSAKDKILASGGEVR
ncbi:50S ribosomal protein L15 [Candidatus Uhrbacteria bacterium]|nr:50S ribosomal protein L15 [Candidatus Uhrbacteria bacterium]